MTFKGIPQIALLRTEPVFHFFLSQGSINCMDCFHLGLFYILLLSLGNNAQLEVENK